MSIAMEGSKLGLAAKTAARNRKRGERALGRRAPQGTLRSLTEFEFTLLGAASP
jgi:hypothetical protein